MCDCCGLLLDVRGACTVCDDGAVVDPPHECERRGETVASAEPPTVVAALQRVVEATP